MSDQVSSNPPPRSLYMKHDVATDLHETAKARLTAKMKAKTEEEEAKLQSRRAKQEQQLALRSKKKATYQTAKDSEAVVTTACVDLEAALALKAASKKNVDAVNADVSKAADAVGVAKERLAAAKDKLTRAIQAQNTVRQATDVTIVEQKSQRLRETWDNSRKAWDLIQKGIRKRPAPEGKDRSLTKRVKGLLGI